MNTLCLNELSHLWQLAHEALMWSFELSSYFMSVFHTNLRQHNVTLSNISVTDFCPSCGTLWIPGWTCSVRLQRSSSKRYWRQAKHVRAKQSPPQPNYWIQYQCQRCCRIIKFERKKYIVSKEPNVDETLPISDSNASKPIKTRAEQNMNSRKRKKLRSEGLQGLLNRIAREEAIENELSLQDFML